jgi:signal peptidase
MSPTTVIAALRRRRRQPLTPGRRALSFAWTLLTMSAMAWLMWPTALGGAANFVVVQGTSMEPTYHSGDLLYVRTTDSYSPGDIAVYQLPSGEAGGGQRIVHRIQSETNGRFTFQGDNRDTPDATHPKKGQLLGSPVANLGPYPTRALFALPLILSLILGVIVTVILWPSNQALEDEPDHVDQHANELDEPLDESLVGAEASATWDLAPWEVLVDADVAWQAEDTLTEDVLHDLSRPAFN